MKNFQTGKRILIPLFLIAATFFANETLGAGNRMDVSLRAQDKTTRTKEISNDEREGAGGEDRSTSTELKKEDCTLKVEIKLRGVQSSPCQLEWYFLSDSVKSMRDKGDVVIFDSGKRSLTLEDNVLRSETVVSKTFELKRQTRNWSDSADTLSGDTYKGYIVLVTANGEILAKTSNSSRFLKDEWLEKCRR